MHCGKRQTQKAMPHQLKPGTVLNGNILIGSVLGQGGFGITYIGRNLGLNRRVAVKEYFPSQFYTRNNSVSNTILYTGSENNAIYVQGKKRFIEEAQMLAQLKGQAGIVEVWDCFEENDTAYYVMEYLDGMTLRQYVKHNGTFHPETLLEKLHPIIQALGKIHRNGLIHRDISPDNIILKKDGTLTLFDFGAARNVEEQKSLSIILKPGFAPYEQYCGDGRQGPWTDVYALCATIYYCITGIVPPDAASRLRNNTLKLPSELGIALAPGQESALCKGMSVLEEKRYQSMEALEQALWAGEEDDAPMSKQEDNKTVVNQVEDAATILESGINDTKLEVLPSVLHDYKHEEKNGNMRRLRGKRCAYKRAIPAVIGIFAVIVAVLIASKIGIISNDENMQLNLQRRQSRKDTITAEKQEQSDLEEDEILAEDDGQSENDVDTTEIEHNYTGEDPNLQQKLVRMNRYSNDGLEGWIEYFYNAQGQLVRAENYYYPDQTDDPESSGYETYGYDKKGNVVAYSQYSFNGFCDLSFFFKYDNNDRLIYAERLDASSLSTVYEYQYAEDGQLQSFCEKSEFSGEMKINFEYCEYGISSVVYDIPDDNIFSDTVSRISFEYNNRGDKIRTTSFLRDGSVFMRCNYIYDLEGNITTEWNESGDGAITNITKYTIPEFFPDIYGNASFSVDYMSLGPVELHYSYDKGKCVSAIGIDNEGNYNYWVEYEYGENGELLSRNYYNKDGEKSHWWEYIYQDYS